MRVDSHTQIRQAMRVDSHTQIRQAMRVLIHTHISCRLLVEGSAPNPPVEPRISFCGCAFCERFLSVPYAPFRSIGCRESRHLPEPLGCPKKGHPLEQWGGKTPPHIFFPATVATVATVLGVPLKTPSRPLRALRFTRLLQTRVLPPPCRSAGYAVRRVCFCSRTLPDVLPTDGWHSHSDAW